MLRRKHFDKPQHKAAEIKLGYCLKHLRSKKTNFNTTYIYRTAQNFSDITKLKVITQIIQK